MTTENFQDGNVLTASGLNDGLGRRMSFYLQAGGGSTGSIAAETTLADAYIPSGVFASACQVLVIGNVGINGSSSQTATLSAYIGPSGTAPTLVALGGASIRGFSSVITHYVPYTFIGSTTIDSASIPAMIRFTAQNVNTGTMQNGTFSILGVGSP